MFNLIAPERQLAVSIAIQTAFPAAKLTAIKLLDGGYSTASTYQIVINDKAYVLRVMGLDQPLADRQIQVTCYQTAAKLAIAPACYFADAEAGIIIMQYIEAVPWPSKEVFLQQMADVLHHMHHSAEFPAAYSPLFDYINNIIVDLIQYPLPDLLLHYFELIKHTQQILTPHLIKQSCHNDLNPNNILFDGKKIWLIDWEAAGQEDPYFDLAMLYNHLIATEQARPVFLKQYFGNTPTDWQSAKLYLMQQIAHAFPGIHFLLFATQAGKPIVDLAVPTLQEWEKGYTAGTIKLQTPDDFLLYGWVQVKTSMHKIASASFLQAKQILLN